MNDDPQCGGGCQCQDVPTSAYVNIGGEFSCTGDDDVSPADTARKARAEDLAYGLMEQRQVETVADMRLAKYRGGITILGVTEAQVELIEDALQLEGQFSDYAILSKQAEREQLARVGEAVAALNETVDVIESLATVRADVRELKGVVVGLLKRRVRDAQGALKDIAARRAVIDDLSRPA